MTVANIQNALVNRLTEILKDFPLKTSFNDPTPFKIFRHKIPERISDQFDYSDEDTHEEVYPFCLVKIDQGQKESNEKLEENVLNILIGVKNESFEGEGYDDVMACIQAIWNDFNHNPILEKKYLFKYPLSWALDGSEEERHPFYYGGIQLTFESKSMTQGGYVNGQ